MKIKIILTGLLLFINQNLAQAQKLNIGLKGGYNLSNVSNSFTENSSTSTGFNLYAFKEIDITGSFSITGELGYTQKGFKIFYGEFHTKNVIIENSEIKYDLDYIDLSAYGNVSITSFPIGSYFFAGPSIGIKINNLVSASTPELNSYISILRAGFEEYENITFGFKFGIGAEFNINSNISTIVEIRYNTDMTSTYTKENWFGGPDAVLKNYLFEFIAGIKF